MVPRRSVLLVAAKIYITREKGAEDSEKPNRIFCEGEDHFQSFKQLEEADFDAPKKFQNFW